MAAGIRSVARKGTQEDTQDPAAARIAELERTVAERDQQLAWMADRVAQMEAAAPAAKAAAPAPAAAVAKAAPPPAPDPLAEFRALSIVAKATPGKGSRSYWHAELVRLGEVLAPDAPPSVQMAKALTTDEGKSFLAAKTGLPVEELVPPPPPVGKGGGDDPVMEAVAFAREGVPRPPSFWRAALAALGQRLAPGQSPGVQMQAIAGTVQGRTLLAALTGDPSALVGR